MIRWVLLAAQLAGAGTRSAQDCAVCHRREAEAAAFSQMTHALQRAGESDVLRNSPNLTFRSGNFSYSIRREGNQSIYSVTDGAVSIRAPLEWGFGALTVGQTYLYRRDDPWYEAPLSYYP